MYKRTKIEAEVHPRFLCLEEFMNYTGLGRGSAMKLGKEIGCVMKVGNRASKQKNIVRSRPGRGKSEKNGNWKKPV